MSFTVELAEDFEDNKLPTLDCKLWFNEDWSLNHTYFEKPMKSQMKIPARSAMPDRQRMNILSNGLIRRLSNIKLEQAEEGEVVKVINQFTSQLRTSGYERKKSREIVVAGVTGWRKKIERRKEQGIGFYRGASSTIKQRMKKKLFGQGTGTRGRRRKLETRGKQRMME